MRQQVLGVTPLFHTVLAAELVNAARGIHHFLGTGIERVALGAYIEMKLPGSRRAGFENFTAAAGYADFSVVGMYVWLHGSASKIKFRHGQIAQNTRPHILKGNRPDGKPRRP
jgi:hypothetical protein